MGETNNEAYVTLMMSTGQKITGKAGDIVLCNNEGLFNYSVYLDSGYRFITNVRHVIAIRPAREEEISEAQAHGG